MLLTEITWSLVAIQTEILGFIGSILHDVTPHTDGASMKLLEVCMFSCAVCKLP